MCSRCQMLSITIKVFGFFCYNIFAWPQRQNFVYALVRLNAGSTLPTLRKDDAFLMSYVIKMFSSISLTFFFI